MAGVDLIHQRGGGGVRVWEGEAAEGWGGRCRCALLCFGIFTSFHFTFAFFYVFSTYLLAVVSIPTSVLWVNLVCFYIFFFIRPLFVSFRSTHSVLNPCPPGRGSTAPSLDIFHPKPSPSPLPAGRRRTLHYCFNRCRIERNVSRRCVSVSRPAGARYKWRVVVQTEGGNRGWIIKPCLWFWVWMKELDETASLDAGLSH